MLLTGRRCMSSLFGRSLYHDDLKIWKFADFDFAQSADDKPFERWDYKGSRRLRLRSGLRRKVFSTSTSLSASPLRTLWVL